MSALFVCWSENPRSFNGQRPEGKMEVQTKRWEFFSVPKNPPEKKPGAAFKQVGPKKTVIRSPAPVL